MLPHTRAQRVILFAGLPVLALMLHLMFCSWKYKETVGVIGGTNHVRMPMVTYTHGVLASTRRSVPAPAGGLMQVTVSSAWAQSGLFARHSLETAKICGVVVPLMLIGATVYLFAGWRYSDRRSRGACTRCGHLMAPGAKGRCPECGCTA